MMLSEQSRESTHKRARAFDSLFASQKCPMPQKGVARRAVDRPNGRVWGCGGSVLGGGCVYASLDIHSRWRERRQTSSNAALRDRLKVIDELQRLVSGARTAFQLLIHANHGLILAHRHDLC